MDELEAQRQAYIQQEQEQHDQSMDSAIDILSSNIPSDGFNSSNGLFPSSPLAGSQSSTISLDQGFAADQISVAEQGEF